MTNRITDKLSEAKPSLIFLNHQLENKVARDQIFLAILSIFLGIPYILITVLMLTVYLLSGQSYALVLVVIEVSGIGICGFGFWCSRRPKAVLAGSWVIIGYTNVAIGAYAWLFGPTLPIPAGFLSGMILSLFLLPWYATAGFTVVELIFTALLYISNLNGYEALIQLDKTGGTFLAMAFWAVVLVTPTALGIFLWMQQKQIYTLALEQTRQLSQALEEIESKRHFGQNVSQHIRSVTAELNATASQQTSGSQNQVNAIIEATEFLRELAYTAQNIANKTENMTRSSEHMLVAARQVKASAMTVTETGAHGLKAVEQTINRNYQVNELYDKLVTILVELQKRSGEIKAVLSLMQSISDETHLLSLNAAIEAAGAGQHGQRFAVVAGEVKALSDRSVKASKQISQILGLVEDSIQVAVSVARDDQSETQEAVKIAQESGTVISVLAQALNESTEEIVKIEAGLVTMNNLTREISFATAQQYSASDQAVASLQEVGTVAQQGASGSQQVINTAHELEELSHELAQVLAA